MRLRLLLITLFLLILTLPVMAQEPDSDGDGVGDSADFCYQTPGTADLYGCTAETLPDIDGDRVPDPIDTCITEAGDANNFGCPAGVIPDLDRDGVPDAQDQCRTEYAQTPDGCLPDADGDNIPDATDGCPSQAGTGDNLGCPAGVQPQDSDGDTVPDIFDSCPDVSGKPELIGCTDSDGDNTPDNIDQCPDQAGETTLFGCVSVTTTTLPASLTPISSANAAQVHEVASLTVGLPRFAVTPDGTLAVRSSDNLLVYNLNDSSLTPRADVVTGWSGYPVAAGSGYLATFELPSDFSTPPYIQIRDGNGTPLSRIEATKAPNGETLGINSLRFHPLLPLLAITQTYVSGASSTIPAPILLQDASGGGTVGQFATINGAINVAFSGDGTRLAGDTVDGGTIHVNVWDVGTQALITSFDTGMAAHFMGTPMVLNADGSLAVVGYPDGTVNLWIITPSGAQKLASLQVLDTAQNEVVAAVALSPDGTVAAVTGGVPYSAGLTGEERFPIMLIDVGKGSVIARIGEHESLPRDLAFSADGRLLISAGDSTVRFWGIG